MPLLQAFAFLPFVDSCVPRTENAHVFSFECSDIIPRAGRAFKKRKKRRNDELSSKFETISRHGEDMKETRRMSTAATAAYQAAQVESRIWLSQSSTRDSRREDGEVRKRSMRRVARGEGTAPKHPCMNAHSLTRFPHLPGLSWTPRVRFTSSLLPRERLPVTLASLLLLLRLCNNVLTYWST